MNSEIAPRAPNVWPALRIIQACGDASRASASVRTQSTASRVSAARAASRRRSRMSSGSAPGTDRTWMCATAWEPESSGR